MSLKNRIDFAGIISARMCNPNGDPTNGNAPRTDWDGYGIISDVCLKRKIRDRLQEAGYEILMQSQGKQTDGLYSTYDRVKAVSWKHKSRTIRICLPNSLKNGLT